MEVPDTLYLDDSGSHRTVHASCNDNPVCETAKETQMYTTVFWTLWERERVGYFVKSIYITLLQYLVLHFSISNSILNVWKYLNPGLVLSKIDNQILS